MQTRLENNRLTIALQGRVDSGNAHAFEQEILAAVKEAPGAALVLDGNLLEYISSAGLRVLMKLRKLAGKALPVVNVSPEVYDIFEMTGFTELLDVKKRMREISLEGAELIGKGGNGAVYRLNRDTIVKVYYGLNTLEKIERDREVSRAVFVQGINTAIPYDVVRVGNDYGVVYEMVEADTLGRFLAQNPDKLEEYTHRMTALLKQLHGTEFRPGQLPDARGLFYYRIDLCEQNGLLTPDEAHRLRAFTDSIPARRTFVHGDFHPGNIMVMDDDLVLIDVGDAGVGHPVIDLMGMYLIYVVAANSGSGERYCGLGKEPLTRMWPIILRDYFETDDPEPYARAIEGVSMLKLMLGIGVNPGISEEQRRSAMANVKGKFFENMDRLVIVP